MSSPGQPPAQPSGNPRGRRKWIFRFAALFLVPALLFGLLEVGLRLAGYGYSTNYFLDGAATEGEGMCVDNPDFGRWVFPGGFERPPQPGQFAFAAKKPTNTYRVFVLGESAALGFPDPSMSFARVLEAMLRLSYPDKRIEVINTSMVAINSHVIVPIAKECAGREADLLVVHVGNNEVVGPFGAAGVLGPYSPSVGLIRANLQVRSTRTGQLLGRTIHYLQGSSREARHWEGMAMFRNSQMHADDARLSVIYNNFGENLRDICLAGAGQNIPVIVCTIPVNLKDCAPFASLHAAELTQERIDSWEIIYRDGVRLEAANEYAKAARRYAEAAELDDRYAELAFRRGRCAAALGKKDEARKYFVQACDLDALRFRSGTAINDTIRSVVASIPAKGIGLADLVQVFADDSPAGIPGEESFFEHVHMNFHGNYLAARAVFQNLVKQAPTSLGKPTQGESPPSEERCASCLGYTEWSEIASRSYIQKMFEKSPFSDQFDNDDRKKRGKAKLDSLQTIWQKDGLNRAQDTMKNAVKSYRDDWVLRMNYGDLLGAAGNVDGAQEQYRAVLGRLHHCFPAHAKLGALALRQGRNDEAMERFRTALKMDPDCKDAIYGQARVLAAMGNFDEGYAMFQRQVEKEVDRAGALTGLGIFLERFGKADLAKARYEEALGVEPNHVNAHLRLGDLAMKNGKQAEALQHYEAVVRVNPEMREATDRIAKLRKNSGEK